MEKAGLDMLLKLLLQLLLLQLPLLLLLLSWLLLLHTADVCFVFFCWVGELFITKMQ